MTTQYFDAAYALAVKQILLESFRDKITIIQLAQRVGVGEKTLKRAFKNEYQMGIYEFQVKLRMEKAQEYLLGRNKSVKQVAYLVGYKRQSSFTKQFVKTYGIAPTEWLIQRDRLC